MTHFDQDTLFFNLYLILAICLLLFLLFLMFFNLARFIKVFFYRLFYFNNSMLDFYFINKQQWLFLVDYYINTCQWFICITFIEHYMSNAIDDRKYYYLGYCYQKLSYSAISLYYYSKVLSSSSYYILTLTNLIILYDFNKSSINVVETCNKLLDLEPSNVIAKKYLDKYRLQ